MSRGDLTEEGWRVIEPLLPAELGRWGRPAQDNRKYGNGMLWVLRTGAPWLAMPKSAFKVEDMINHLPSMDVVHSVGGQTTEFEKFIRRTPGDPAWREESFLNEGDPYKVPTLWVFQAYDIALGPNVAAFEYAATKADDEKVRDNQFMIVSGMGHCSLLAETAHTVNGEREIGDARYPYLEVFTKWFDYWLKGIKNDVLERPKAELYVSGRNQWRPFTNWPPRQTAITYYLDSNGDANSRMGGGKLTPQMSQQRGLDRFSYDPRYPVPSVGGDVCCVGPEYRPGSFDQSTMELRHDVLVYTSSPLTKPQEVIGFVDVVPHASSDATDTDFTAKLVDVYPDGRAFNVGESIQRARWREGYDSAKFMKKDEIYEVRIGPFFVSNHFAAGHQLRLDITGRNFPRLKRNLNTGDNNFDEIENCIAHDSVHHAIIHPLRVVLPIVPEEK